MKDIFKLKAHPAADAFPMMPDDELDELAAGIKADGLQVPLVTCEHEGKTVLLDGRNRREACKRAGVKPDFTEYDGDDPVGYVIAANVNRRHMTKGQRAMVVAKLFETNNLKQHEAAEMSGLNRSRIAYARTVLSYAPELADAVVDGAVPLDVAYGEARGRKNKETDTDRRMKALQREASDLADKVVNGEMSLEESENEFEERKEKRRLYEVGVATSLANIVRSAHVFQDEQHLDDSYNIFKNTTHLKDIFEITDESFVERIDHMRDGIDAFLSRIYGEEKCQNTN